jgi:hypothetical protein
MTSTSGLALSMMAALNGPACRVEAPVVTFDGQRRLYDELLPIETSAVQLFVGSIQVGVHNFSVCDSLNDHVMPRSEAPIMISVRSEQRIAAPVAIAFPATPMGVAQDVIAFPDALVDSKQGAPSVRMVEPPAVAVKAAPQVHDKFDGYALLPVAPKGADGGTQRTLPVHPELRTWLQERLRPFGPHVLRHTFGTQLVRAGVDLVTVAELMGDHPPLALPSKADHERRSRRWCPIAEPTATCGPAVGAAVGRWWSRWRAAVAPCLQADSAQIWPRLWSNRTSTWTWWSAATLTADVAEALITQATILHKRRDLLRHRRRTSRCTQ